VENRSNAYFNREKWVELWGKTKDGLERRMASNINVVGMSTLPNWFKKRLRLGSRWKSGGQSGMALYPECRAAGQVL